MSGFNPTLTIQAVTYMSADAIVNRYKKKSRTARGSLAPAPLTGTI